MVVGAAPGQGCHRAGGRDAAPGRGIALRRRRTPGARSGADRSGAELDAAARSTDGGRPRSRCGLADRRGGRAGAPTRSSSSRRDESIAGALDPGFHARALGIATEMVADATLEAAGAEPASGRRLGMADETAPQALAQRLVSHLSFRSVWFRNALRGAVGLALAVGVVEITNVQHGFWVVLGTMSVLRSSALGTGATALRAVGGTAVGFIVGSVIMIGLADHSVFLWVVLPFAVLLSGMAPSMISFAAGQAAFTLVVIILFNIIQPIGWQGRADEDRGRGHRLRGQHRGRDPLLAPGCHRSARAALFRRRLRPARHTWPTRSNG